uniref:Histone deacetylase domain-containing protein n=1 Tax=Plectus sambesii TaxID=2011161 RepID=A0A914XQJ8_9BILA
MSSTGVVYDQRHELHKCLWDETFPENPERLFAVCDRLKNRGLFERTTSIECKPATEEQILLCHPSSLLEKLKECRNAPDAEALENACKQFEEIYLTQDSFDCALLAVGGAIEAARAVATGKCRNAFAIIRPPGHHSYEANPNGFCIFNNIAIAAKQMVKEFDLKRVLIVDVDIHAPQGTLRSIADSEQILLISIHNYMGGAIWPFMKETNYDYDGNTINVPLNAPGLSDAEYLAAFQHFIIPIAVEYNPQLILVSAGFDAGLGDPLGGQKVTPPCFGHLTRMLMDVAEGKVCLILEGGYFKASFVESAEMSLRALLGDPLPLLHIHQRLCPTFIESLRCCISHQAKRWKCCATISDLLQQQQTASDSEIASRSLSIFVGQPIFEHFERIIRDHRCSTRNWFPVRPREKEEALTKEIEAISANYKLESEPETPLISLEALLFSQETHQKALIEMMKNIVDHYSRFEQLKNSHILTLLSGDKSKTG